MKNQMKFRLNVIETAIITATMIRLKIKKNYGKSNNQYAGKQTYNRDDDDDYSENHYSYYEGRSRNNYNNRHNENYNTRDQYDNDY